MAALLFFALMVVSCKGEATLRDEYGSDADYYLALLARRAGDEAEAERLFAQCAAQGEGIASRRSAEEISALPATDEDNPAPPPAPSLEQSDTGATGVALLHECVAKRQYEKAYSYMPAVRQYIAANKTSPLASIISDIGKAALYAAGDKSPRASEMDAIAAAASGAKDSGDAVYNAVFYAARLYAMQGNAAAAKCFYDAAKIAPTGAQSDNALWYLLSMEMAAGTDMGLKAFAASHTLWHDASYFDDIMEGLSQKLLAARRYAEYERVCTMLLSDKKARPLVYAASSAAAQYAYICARLVQEHFISEGAEGLPDVKMLLAFALDDGAERYYRVLAMTALSSLGYWQKAKEDETQAALLRTGERRQADTNAAGSEAEKFLMGFADFGLTDMIYPEWQAASEGDKYISLECALHLAKALRDEGYTEQCLRVMARSAKCTEKGTLPQEALECLFPQGYKDEIEDACKEFGVNEEYAFALVRSESFFNHKAVSAAGAAGLTQLMDGTAQDIARTLKRDGDIDLEDPTVNIEFGVKYLADLTGRMQGSPLLAFLSYNTGITRIRRYVKENESGAHPLPLDLLLETLPYKETRDYGRKLVSAAAMYGYLYYGKSVQSVVDSVMQREGK